MILLAADVGGTNTRLLLAEYSGKDRMTLYEKNYPSHQYNNFYDVVTLFLEESNVKDSLDVACIAVAGPVINAEASITNLPWIISEEILKKHLHIESVKLINDFSAISYGISELNKDDIEVLQQGDLVSRPTPSAVIIGAGTGLGVSHRVWINDHYHVFPSEAGHTTFAPQDVLQSQLLMYLFKKYNYVSLESILSGRGFLVLYHFLKDELLIPESTKVKQQLSNEDPAQVITQAALNNTDLLCEKTVELYIKIYGAAVGNAALYYYPVDEVYIAGGIAPKLKTLLKSKSFISALTNKGLMSENMKKLTLKLITQDKVGLLGALEYSRAYAECRQ